MPYHRRYASLPSCAAIFAAAAALLLGQTSPFPSGSPSARSSGSGDSPLRLDVQELLTNERVVQQSFSDGVWNITDDPERDLIILPLRIEGEVTEPTDLDNDAASIMGGRFVAWYVPREEGEDVSAGGGSRRSRSRAGLAPDMQQHQQRMMEMMPRMGGPGSGASGRFNPARRSGGGTNAADGSALEKTPPRLTRDLTLLPGGELRWEMSRAILGGEVAGDASNAYTLLLDRSQLQRPQDPRRGGSNGTGGQRGPEDYPGGYGPGGLGGGPSMQQPQRQLERPQRSSFQELQQRREQQRQAQRQYVQEVQAYRRIVRMLNDLPTEFTEPAPRVVWAIYSVPTRLPRLGLQGEPPLPWTLSFERFQELRRLATGDAQAGALSQAVRGLLQEDRAIARRAAAVVLAAGTNLQQVGGDLVPAIQRLFETGEMETRRMLVQALTQEPANIPAARVLLETAMSDPSPLVSLPAMRARLQLASSNGAGASGMIVQRLTSTVSNLLASTQQAPVGEALGVVFDLARQAPSAQGILAQRIDLSQAAPAQQSEVARAVVAQARGGSPLALRWLENQLLGSDSKPLRHATLRVIAEGPTAATASAEDQRFDRPGGQNAGYLPITSPQYPLIGMLQGPASETRRLAWTALPEFRIDLREQTESATANADGAFPGPPPREPGMPPGGRGPHLPPGYGRGAQQGDASAVEQLLQKIADAALAIQPTPLGAVAFFANQDQAEARRAVLKRILFEGQGPAQGAAARRIASEGGQEFARTLAGMTADQRQAIGRVCYQALSGDGGEPMPATAVVGLLRRQGENNQPAPIVSWFAERIASGHVPHPREWASAVMDQQALLSGIVSDDQAYGRACAAAKIATVAWPTDQRVSELRKAAFDAAGQSAGSAGGLAALWQQRRQQLAEQVLAEADGTYIVSVEVRGNGSGDGGDGPMEPRRRVGAFSIARGSARQLGARQRARHQAPLGAQPRNGDGADESSATAGGSPPGTLTLGRITLSVNDQAAQVEGANMSIQVVKDPPTLRVPLPSQFDNIGSASAAAPSIPWPLAPLNLRPSYGGRWSGELALEDGGVIEVTLRPAASSNQ